MFDSPAKMFFLFFSIVILLSSYHPPFATLPRIHSSPLPPPAAVIVHCSVHYLTHCVGVDPPACPPVGASFCCRMQIYSPQKRRNMSLDESIWDTHTSTHTHTHIMYICVCVCVPRALGSRRTTWPQVSGLVGLALGNSWEAFGCEIEMWWLNNRCL